VHVGKMANIMMADTSWYHITSKISITTHLAIDTHYPKFQEDACQKGRFLNDDDDDDEVM